MKTKINCVALAFVLVALLTGISCRGPQADSGHSGSETMYGAVVERTEKHGISLMSRTPQEDEYEKYGISAAAETAYILTASVVPSSVQGAKVDWSVAFVNKNLWKFILGVILLILLVVLLAPVLPYIIKAVVWIIMLPFRAIAAIVKAVRRAKDKKK